MTLVANTNTSSFSYPFSSPAHFFPSQVRLQGVQMIHFDRGIIKPYPQNITWNLKNWNIILVSLNVSSSCVSFNLEAKYEGMFEAVGWKEYIFGRRRFYQFKGVLMPAKSIHPSLASILLTAKLLAKSLSKGWWDGQCTDNVGVSLYLRVFPHMLHILIRAERLVGAIESWDQLIISGGRWKRMEKLACLTLRIYGIREEGDFPVISPLPRLVGILLTTFQAHGKRSSSDVHLFSYIQTELFPKSIESILPSLDWWNPG